MNTVDFRGMKVKDLKAELQKVGLPVTGTQSVLIERLEQHYAQDPVLNALTQQVEDATAQTPNVKQSPDDGHSGSFEKKDFKESLVSEDSVEGKSLEDHPSDLPLQPPQPPNPPSPHGPADLNDPEPALTRGEYRYHYRPVSGLPLAIAGGIPAEGVKTAERHPQYEMFLGTYLERVELL